MVVRRVRRILAGQALLHKLPYYVAIPAGAAVGLGVGYAASVPGAGPTRIALVVGAFLAVVALALVAPQPIRKSASVGAPIDPDVDDPELAAHRGKGPVIPSDIPPVFGNDSLCD